MLLLLEEVEEVVAVAAVVDVVIGEEVPGFVSDAVTSGTIVSDSLPPAAALTTAAAAAAACSCWCWSWSCW